MLGLYSRAESQSSLKGRKEHREGWSEATLGDEGDAFVAKRRKNPFLKTK